MKNQLHWALLEFKWMDKRVWVWGPQTPDQRDIQLTRVKLDLADARIVRLRSRPRLSNESLMSELDEVRSLLDQGLSAEAGRERLTSLISTARNCYPSVLGACTLRLVGRIGATGTLP